jgi:hypothetical protein
MMFHNSFCLVILLRCVTISAPIYSKTVTVQKILGYIKTDLRHTEEVLVSQRRVEGPVQF